MANGRLSYVVSLDNTLQDVEDSKAGFNLEELRVILLLCLFFFLSIFIYFFHPTTSFPISCSFWMMGASISKYQVVCC